MTIRSYRDLEAWRLAMNLTVAIYGMSERLPRSELYGLTTQIRRAAVSIPSNISEGHRRGTRAYRHFVRVALGSLAEVETQVELIRRLAMVSADDTRELADKTAELARVLHGLHRALTRKLQSEAPPPEP